MDAKEIPVFSNLSLSSHIYDRFEKMKNYFQMDYRRHTGAMLLSYTRASVFIRRSSHRTFPRVILGAAADPGSPVLLQDSSLPVWEEHVVAPCHSPWFLSHRESLGVTGGPLYGAFDPEMAHFTSTNQPETRNSGGRFSPMCHRRGDWWEPR